MGQNHPIFQQNKSEEQNICKTYIPKYYHIIPPSIPDIDNNCVNPKIKLGEPMPDHLAPPKFTMDF